jgi:hypothetical protein
MPSRTARDISRKGPEYGYAERTERRTSWLRLVLPLAVLTIAVGAAYTFGPWGPRSGTARAMEAARLLLQNAHVEADLTGYRDGKEVPLARSCDYRDSWLFEDLLESDLLTSPDKWERDLSGAPPSDVSPTSVAQLKALLRVHGGSASRVRPSRQFPAEDGVLVVKIPVEPYVHHLYLEEAESRPVRVLTYRQTAPEMPVLRLDIYYPGQAHSLRFDTVRMREGAEETPRAGPASPPVAVESGRLTQVRAVRSGGEVAVSYQLREGQTMPYLLARDGDGELYITLSTSNFSFPSASLAPVDLLVEPADELELYALWPDHHEVIPLPVGDPVQRARVRSPREWRFTRAIAAANFFSGAVHAVPEEVQAKLGARIPSRRMAQHYLDEAQWLMNQRALSNVERSHAEVEAARANVARLQR